MTSWNLIIVGGGPAGLMAAITAGRAGRRVLVLEAQARCGRKIDASGGGRCNIANTLPVERIMERFGRNGRFMEPALRDFDGAAIVAFFQGIGVDCHAPDGFHYWPITHKATTVTDALVAACAELGVTIRTDCAVERLLVNANRVSGVIAGGAHEAAEQVILATGGLGYPQIGGNDSGHRLASETGHRITDCHPAMQPLYCAETWPAGCRSHTLPKVTMRVDLKKHRRLVACGDLICTERGIAGPVVKDFAREVNPLIERYGSVPLRLDLVRGRDQEACLQAIDTARQRDPAATTVAMAFDELLPPPYTLACCAEHQVDPASRLAALPGATRDAMIAWCRSCPLTVTGSPGFRQAMVTRGGVSLKDIDPQTLASKRIDGLRFCGEAIDLDGPCGGFNLTWAWASGRLAGSLR